ncbi:MAG: 30S ribosomal protein S8 [Planctomycetota bacterium]
MMTDPIADMLTRIRNANAIRHESIDVPSSKMKQRIAEVMKREGYIKELALIEQKPQNILRITLKYGPDKEKILNGLERVSKPGRKVYYGVKDIKPVLGGTGIKIVSTPKGILSDRECRKLKVGGECLCTIW